MESQGKLLEVGGDHVGAPGVGEVSSGALRRESFRMEVLRSTNRRLAQKSSVGRDVQMLVLKCTQVDRMAQLNLVIRMRKKREDKLVFYQGGGGGGHTSNTYCR